MDTAVIWSMAGSDLGIGSIRLAGGNRRGWWATKNPDAGIARRIGV